MRTPEYNKDRGVPSTGNKEKSDEDEEEDEGSDEELEMEEMSEDDALELAEKRKNEKTIKKEEQLDEDESIG